MMDIRTMMQLPCANKNIGDPVMKSEILTNHSLGGHLHTGTAGIADFKSSAGHFVLLPSFGATQNEVQGLLPLPRANNVQQFPSLGTPFTHTGPILINNVPRYSVPQQARRLESTYGVGLKAGSNDDRMVKIAAGMIFRNVHPTLSMMEPGASAPFAGKHDPSMVHDVTSGMRERVQMGPVEKAVLQQAMYNQSIKQTPTMRRCDDCNIIFNSLMQAEMHYKGKKHAGIMYLKRSRETKMSATKFKKDYSFDIKKGLVRSEAELTVQNSTHQSTLLNDSNIKPSLELGSNSDVACLRSSSITSHHGTNYGNVKSTCTEGDEGNLLRYKPYHCRKKLPSQNENKLGVVESARVETVNTLKTNYNLPEIYSASDIGFQESLGTEDEPKLNFRQTEIHGGSEIDIDSSSKYEVDATANDECNVTELNDKDKNLDVSSIPQREPVILPDPLPSYIKKVDRPAVLKESLRCNVCDIYVNSENQMKQHVNSLRHKNIEQGIPTPPKLGKDEKPKIRAEQFRCEICRVTLNSDIQLLQHLSSQRHKNMLEGRPPKPRWTPYERSQQTLLRSSAQMRPSFAALPNPNPAILVSHAMNGSIPITNLSVASPTAIAGSPTAHLKHTSFIAPNGGIYQTREIVYVGTGAARFPPTFQQQHITSANPIPLSQMHIPQRPDFAQLIQNASVPTEQTSPVMDWQIGTGRLAIKHE